MSHRSSLAGRSFILLLLLVLVGCATPLKQGIYLAPDFQQLAITEMAILPALDLRIDKKVGVKLEKQIRNPAYKILKSKGYLPVKSDSLGGVGQILEDDLKAAEANWIKRLGPSGSRYVMVLCLMDVATKLTFGSSGNAEIAGYMFDKEAGTVIWHDKGTCQKGQGGLFGMLTKFSMDEEAIYGALSDMLASVPKGLK